MSAGSQRNSRPVRFTLSAAFAFLLAGMCLAGPAYRVKDINQRAGTFGTFDRGAGLDGKVYFRMDDGWSGAEPWRSDGTLEGTELLRDIAPGFPPSDPRSFTAFQSRIYFVVYPSSGEGTGTELWVTDGTSSGTRALIPRTIAREPEDLVVSGDRLGFIAVSPETGSRRVWLSDGTPEGTRMIDDPIYRAPRNGMVSAGTALYFFANPVGSDSVWSLYRINAGSFVPEVVRLGLNGQPVPTRTGGFIATPPTDLVGVGNAVFFVAFDPSFGLELWRSDGTPAGTAMVRDINTGAPPSFPRSLTAVGDKLFFVVSKSSLSSLIAGELWTTDGTSAGTRPILAPSSMLVASGVSPIGVLGGSLIFGYVDPDLGSNAVARTDGPHTAAVLLKRVSSVGLFGIPIGGQLLFSASDSEHGDELWKTDGTPAGTILVRDIFPGTSGSRISGLTAFGTLVLFGATDGRAILSLWVSDGSEEGTHVLRDLLFPGSNPADFLTWGSRVVFAAADEGNGSVEANGNNPWRRLWVSDGTEAGTKKLADHPVLLAGDSDGSPPVVWRDDLYFSGSDGLGFEPWRSDGTDAGTSRLKDISPGSGSSYPLHFTPFGDSLFFLARDPDMGFQIFRTDGSEGTTSRVTSISISFLGDPFLVSAQSLFFFAEEPVHGQELWRSDGSAAGTAVVKDINPGGASSFAGTSKADFKNRLFFLANDGTHGAELWRSDGTESGTVLVKDLAPGPASSVPSRLTPFAGALFFTACSGVDGISLWRTDGTDAGTVVVRSFPGSGSGSFCVGFFRLDHLTVSGRYLFFVADDGASGTELWRTDGTAEGTLLVRDIFPGPGSSSPTSLFDAGGVLLFTASDGEHGAEVWRSDGTEAGTLLIDDINPGPRGSIPSGFALAGDLIFFAADDGKSGRELWAMPVSALVDEPRRRVRSPSSVPFRR